MNEIIIIGGGLTGLSCAVKLIENNIQASDITIYEARQEIGSPTRSPGIASYSKNTEFIFNKIKMQKLTLENLQENIISFRREWLEKSILIFLTKKGCNIKLKSKITDKEINEFFKIENITIINCAGNKRKSSGFPADYTDFMNTKKKMIKYDYPSSVKWYGYLSTDNNEFKNQEKYLSINKKDGLNETWVCRDEIENIKFKTIEIMISTYPPKSELILANNTIDRGFLLANKATN